MIIEGIKCYSYTGTHRGRNKFGGFLKHKLCYLSSITLGDNEISTYILYAIKFE